MKFQLRIIATALAISSLMVVAPGCKDFYDVNVDPLHPTKAEVQQLLPVTQTAISTYLGFSIAGLGQASSALMQQLSNARGIGTYQQNGDSFSNQWNGLYSDMLANNEQIITQGTLEQRWGYVGVAQIQKAYVVSQLVDMFGSIPYSQALKGVTNTSPRFDADIDIYNGNTALGIQGLFDLIDEGIANLAKPGAAIGADDIIYGGSAAKWANLGRTLKLKLYVQIRKTRSDADFQTKVSTLIGNSAGLIQAAGEDFEFKYGASELPANRNIGYLSDYVDVNRENNIGRYLYLLMKYGNGALAQATPGAGNDPRIPYYFFNQRTLNNIDEVAFDYQDPGNGRFVTTRQGSTGTAAGATTSNVRTLPGLYPVGGRYDDGSGGNANTSFGRGVVAQRLLPYFSRKFLEAEAQLTILNNQAAALLAMQDAIQASFDKVNAIAIAEGTSTTPNIPGYTATPVPTISASVIAAYKTAATTRFNNATNKLQIIMQEKYIASFGMGPDIYTDWRRTGFPVITVPDAGNIGYNVGLVEDNDTNTRGAGLFPRRLFYSQQDLTANTNPDAPKAQVDPNASNYRIFWDR